MSWFPKVSGLYWEADRGAAGQHCGMKCRASTPSAIWLIPLHSLSSLHLNLWLKLNCTSATAATHFSLLKKIYGFSYPRAHHRIVKYFRSFFAHLLLTFGNSQQSECRTQSSVRVPSNSTSKGDKRAIVSKSQVLCLLEVWVSTLFKMEFPAKW